MQNKEYSAIIRFADETISGFIPVAKVGRKYIYIEHDNKMYRFNKSDGIGWDGLSKLLVFKTMYLSD